MLTLDFCFKHTKPHLWLAVVTGSAEPFSSDSEKSGYQIRQRGRNDKESKKNKHTPSSLCNHKLWRLFSRLSQCQNIFRLYHNLTLGFSVFLYPHAQMQLSHWKMPHFFFQSWTVKPKSQWRMCICDCVCARMYPISWMKPRYWNDTIRCVANQFIFHLPQVVSLRQSPSEFTHTSRTTHVSID